MTKRRRAPAGEPMAYLLAVLTTVPECTAGRWPYANHGGYGTVRVDGPNRTVAAVVCEWYHGPRPSPMHQVRHLCGKGHLGCFSPRCLAWGTPAENTADREASELHVRGARNPNARLTAEQVAEIRSRYQGSQRNRKGTGPTQQALADEYGVTQKMISFIVHGQHWRD